MCPIRPLQLGSLLLPNNVWLAPLSGVSDFPFRMIASSYGPGVLFCEMVKMDALVRHDMASFRMLDYTAAMHPIGAQLCGNSPAYAKAAARIVEDLGFDVIDLNCGCPVDKVTRDGGGAALLKQPLLIGELICAIVGAVSIPVTVKVRAGWSTPIVETLVCIAEQAGAKAITVHGRTRAQGYSGRANREWIRAAKEHARTIRVIGNGDIYSSRDAHAMLQETGCDGVLVARGSLGRPWLLRDIQTGKDSSHECLAALRAHYRATLEYEHEHAALVAMRRVGCLYANRAQRVLREAFGRASSLEDVERAIERYARTVTDGAKTQ